MANQNCNGCGGRLMIADQRFYGRDALECVDCGDISYEDRDELRRMRFNTPEDDKRRKPWK